MLALVGAVEQLKHFRGQPQQAAKDAAEKSFKHHSLAFNLTIAATAGHPPIM